MFPSGHLHSLQIPTKPSDREARDWHWIWFACVLAPLPLCLFQPIKNTYRLDYYLKDRQSENKNNIWRAAASITGVVGEGFNFTSACTFSFFCFFFKNKLFIFCETKIRFFLFLPLCSLSFLLQSFLHPVFVMCRVVKCWMCSFVWPLVI